MLENDSSIQGKLSIDYKLPFLNFYFPFPDLVKVAPEVEYDEDLYYWDKKEVQFNSSGLEFHHRWMGTGIGDNLMPQEMLSNLRKRVVYYEPKDETDIPACRAPMRNGTLCPRKDLFKCPFHGPKIERDNRGLPLNSNSLAASSSSSKRPLWQEIQNEVEKSLGIDPFSRGSKKKQPTALQKELKELNQKTDTSISRLNKIINKRKRDSNSADDILNFQLKQRDKRAFSWK